MRSFTGETLDATGLDVLDRCSRLRNSYPGEGRRLPLTYALPSDAREDRTRRAEHLGHLRRSTWSVGRSIGALGLPVVPGTKSTGATVSKSAVLVSRSAPGLDSRPVSRA